MAEQDLFGEVPPPAAAARPRPSRPRPSVVPPQHTWFFALRPEAADAARLDAFAEKLLASHGVTGKRVGPERLHITLELVGHDSDAQVAEMVEAACRAADAVRFPAIDARFDAAVTFSAPSGPFVLLGGDGLNGVRELRTALGCALAEHGFAPQRSYEPHMTLGYDPRHRVERIAIDPVGFQIAHFALVKSHIGLSRHEVLRVWPLSG
ncbi:2'-5' RNA ligase family protein [Herbaspirillum rhizosphaerae]|uniref:2'-5' RNA ligase family protein n=1 Tax=Herbaspirillum rhizosphaerae TaxID=346179 RepID=UPI0009F8952C|nr:2'-5' RNA ligase family protein [Herbaspirillum rhizosphaerae]